MLGIVSGKTNYSARKTKRIEDLYIYIYIYISVHPLGGQNKPGM